MIRRRVVLDALARRLGYVPAATAVRSWQRVSVPLELPPLEAGDYALSTWVSVFPGQDRWGVAGTELERVRRAGGVPYVVTRADSGEIVEAGAR